MAHHAEYVNLIAGLPRQTLKYACAYGSGAIQQRQENKEKKMVDFILCTDDPFKFHEENIKMNPSHYSLIRWFGPRLVSNFQCNFYGARVFYNTFVQVGNRNIKYGVISTEDLKEDLLDWNWLYVAGRLQKPVLDVIHPTEEIEEYIAQNRRSALQAALLILPDTFHKADLFKAITSLSYTGDFRMKMGEDKNKVAKIVEGGLEKFDEVYEPLLKEDGRLVIQNNEIIQDASGTAIYHRLNLLPSTVLEVLAKDWNDQHKQSKDCEEVMFSLAHRHDFATSLIQALHKIVGKQAMIQTAKNAVTAGVQKSVKYAGAKLLKGYRS